MWRAQARNLRRPATCSMMLSPSGVHVSTRKVKCSRVTAIDPSPLSCRGSGSEGGGAGGLGGRGGFGFCVIAVSVNSCEFQRGGREAEARLRIR